MSSKRLVRVDKAGIWQPRGRFLFDMTTKQQQPNNYCQIIKLKIKLNLQYMIVEFWLRFVENHQTSRMRNRWPSPLILVGVIVFTLRQKTGHWINEQLFRTDFQKIYCVA